MKSQSLVLYSFLLCTLTSVPVVHAQNGNTKEVSKPKTLARLFWQDMNSQSVKRGDLCRVNDQWQLIPNTLEQFPKLDPETQNLVQMESLHQSLIVGIHDNDHGKIGSGWVAISSGVEIEEHGDHVHARFDRPPQISQSTVDTDQGNPAHVYRYGDRVFIANDAKNGFTIIELKPTQNSTTTFESRFYTGGGNHITLAAVSDLWCYCTWADRDRENKGRVDIVPIGANPKSEHRSMFLPVGGLHGATTNAGKVFLAPSDGIFMLNANSSTGENILESSDAAFPMTLGADPITQKPNRTGAFANLGNHVLLCFGSGENSKMGLIDATSQSPKVFELNLDADSDLSPSAPKCTVGANGKQYAWIVLHAKSDESCDVLRVVELDPNGDKNFDDAKIHGSLNLGRSNIKGHSGHHEIAFLPNRRLACISNPGDGSLWLVSLHGLELLAKLDVGGVPTRVAAFGE